VHPAKTKSIPKKHAPHTCRARKMHLIAAGMDTRRIPNLGAFFALCAKNRAIRCNSSAAPAGFPLLSRAQTGRLKITVDKNRRAVAGTKGFSFTLEYYHDF
jgi:uncharacterized protein YijF (DUF1287 family)